MTKNFEVVSNQRTYKKIQSMKDKLMKDITAVIDVSNLKLIEYHRKYYIFNSYEEALEWSIKNPNKGIQWHSKILYWDEHKKKFKSYEQEFDLDGIIIRYYTKEELLKGIQEYIEDCNKKCPEEANRKWWLDEYGKLKYVHI